jgi:hypothetical protein
MTIAKDSYTNLDILQAWTGREQEANDLNMIHFIINLNSNNSST